jgi:N-acetylglucosamine-6-sulfatase
VHLKAAGLALLTAAVVSACGGSPATTRRGPAGVAPAVTPAPTGPSRLSQTRSQRPNLILVMTDDQAAGDMRAMPLTTQLIGGQGVTFTNSFASWPLCCPSRVTAFTGQYAHNHRVLGNYPPAGSSHAFVDDHEALAVWLQRAGYVTAHVGKYLNGYGHDRRGVTYVPPGWNEWFGTIDPSTYQMWGYTINHNGALKTYGKVDREDPAFYQTDVLRRLAIGEIDRAAGGTQPFFLSLAFLAPHEELAEAQDAPLDYPGPRPAPRHVGSFAHLPLPHPPNFDVKNLGRKPSIVAAFSRIFADEPMARRTQRYRRRLESLRAVDEAVQAIVTRLSQHALLDNTVIVFTSDNGWFNGEHHIALGKYLMYEPSIRVPLLVRGPGVAAGHRSDELVANVDLAPTFVELAGARAGRVMDGRSLLPYARDPELRSRRPILLDAPIGQLIMASKLKGGPLVEVPSLRGLRTPRLSYIEHGTGEAELYNMIADPDQLMNLHGVREFHDIESAMRLALQRYVNCAGETCRADVLSPHDQTPATPRAKPIRRPSRAPKARAR